MSRRDIRAQRRDKELFKHFGWGTEFKGEDEAPEQSPPHDPDEYDITEPDTRRQIGQRTAQPGELLARPDLSTNQGMT